MMFEGKALTPSMIVAALDRYIVGQEKAKRSVAIALRNRLRRRLLSPEMAREIAPKNILMVGPTGVGKTEIARRLARLVDAPFVKVEATKFTEVGYVGRDVESMIRDLVEASVQMVKRRKLEEVQEPAALRAEERLLDALLPRPKAAEPQIPDFMKVFMGGARQAQEPSLSESPESKDRAEATREKLRALLREGKLDAREVDIEVQESPQLGMAIPGGLGFEEMGINLGEILGGMLPKKTRRRRVSVAEARRILQAEEAERLLDMEAVSREALEKAQEEGIVFIDEIDKIASTGNVQSGPDVSREGVQRDLLPVVEGCVVQTKYGPVHTDYILFIAAGAFTKTKPSDLVPELQGRLPIRVELSPLEVLDLKRILVEPENSLIKQYQALLSTEGIALRFTDEAILRISELAAQMNREMENIGARRLHTMMEQLLEEISFNAPERAQNEVVIDREFVEEKIGPLVQDEDLRKYLL